VSERKAFPLSWPEGWKRTQSRTNAQFNKSTRIEQPGEAPAYSAKKRLAVSDAVQRLLRELQLMGIPDWNVIISTNVPLRLDGMPRSDKEPADPGAAVYWKKNDKQAMRCMAIDRYTRVAEYAGCGQSRGDRSHTRSHARDRASRRRSNSGTSISRLCGSPRKRRTNMA
jgi:hypothetical protein